MDELIWLLSAAVQNHLFQSKEDLQKGFQRPSNEYVNLPDNLVDIIGINKVNLHIIKKHSLGIDPAILGGFSFLKEVGNKIYVTFNIRLNFETVLFEDIYLFFKLNLPVTMIELKKSNKRKESSLFTITKSKLSKQELELIQKNPLLQELLEFICLINPKEMERMLVYTHEDLMPHFKEPDQQIAWRLLNTDAYEAFFKLHEFLEFDKTKELSEDVKIKFAELFTKYFSVEDYPPIREYEIISNCPTYLLLKKIEFLKKLLDIAYVRGGPPDEDKGIIFLFNHMVSYHGDFIDAKTFCW